MEEIYSRAINLFNMFLIFFNEKFFVCSFMRTEIDSVEISKFHLGNRHETTIQSLNNFTSLSGHSLRNMTIFVFL